MLVLKRNYQFWIAIIALIKLGAVAIPATHLLTTHDFTYRFERASVKAIVCTGYNPDIAKYVDEAQEEIHADGLVKFIANGHRDGWIPFDDEIAGMPETMERVQTDTREHMLLYFTSGTTGYPKMVVHNHRYALAHIQTAAHWQNVDSDGVHLKYSAIAGEALNPEVYNKWLEFTGLKLMEAFGQTESTALLANLVGMTPKPGSMGKPTPLYDVDIVDDDGNPVPVGEVGEIVVRAERGKDGLFDGYYRDDELTAQAWHDGLYHTGDTAWKDEDGYFWYVGRNDDVIKASGYRIGPFEIESVLIAHPSVLECAVTGAPDPIRGQVVKATIVLARGYEPSEELKKELQTYVKKNTAPYKYPRIVEFVDELPKTISGKIRRVQIRNEDNKKNS